MDKSVLSIQNEKDKSNVTVDDEILSVDNENSLGVTNQYMILVSTSDEFYNFVDYLINQNGFKFNTKSTDDGYTIYSNSKYSCKLYDGETYVLPAGTQYFISKNRIGYFLDDYYPDIIYSQNGNTYVDDLFLGWLKNVENYYFSSSTENPNRNIIQTNYLGSNVANIASYNSLQEDYSNLPSSFSLINLNSLTPVKDQADAGTCWIFASIEALESYLMKTENITFDFSENNINNVMSNIGKQGINRTINSGGFVNFALAYFLRWSGPILEEFDKYELQDRVPVNNIPLEFVNAAKHIQGVKYIQKRNGALDNNEIKKAVMDYGGVVTSMWMVQQYPYLNGLNYYYDGNAKEVNNKGEPINYGHEICIFGWDDNYSRNNFVKTPEKDGAFIVRNSWGSDWGNNGYFYISYCDTQLAMMGENEINGGVGFSFTLVENYTNYGKNYNYNPLGVTGWFNKEGYNSYWSQYVAEDDEILKACGIYVNDACNCTIDIFLINNNYLYNATTKKVSLDYAGFHTVNIPFVDVKKGQSFRVRVTIESNNPILLPVEYSWAGSNNTNMIKYYPFVEINLAKTGVYINNVYSAYSNVDFCINVYTEYKKISVSKIDVIDISCHDGFMDVRTKVLDSQNNLLKNFELIYSPDMSSGLKDYKIVYTNNDGEVALRFANGIKIIDNKLSVSFAFYDACASPILKKTVSINLPEIVECGIESVSVSYRSTVGLINIKGNVGVISIGDRSTIGSITVTGNVELILVGSYSNVDSLNVKGSVESIIINNRGKLGLTTVSGSVNSISMGSYSNMSTIYVGGNIKSISTGSYSNIESISIGSYGNIGVISIGSYSTIKFISLNYWSSINSISISNRGNIGTLASIGWSNIGSISTGSYSDIGTISLSDWAKIDSISTGSYSDIGTIGLSDWAKIDSISTGSYSKIGSVSVSDWSSINSVSLGSRASMGSVSVRDWGKIA